MALIKYQASKPGEDFPACRGALPMEALIYCPDRVSPGEVQAFLILPLKFIVCHLKFLDRDWP
jgi:hypothetical protein